MAAHKTTLDMFIPEDRRQALAQGESLPTRAQGAVMFADVSGFTRLTGIFSVELGPKRGAEALTQILDPIYAELVDAIHSFSGSVIVISGDGITCWFGQDDGLRATTCAFAMQEIMARYEKVTVPGGRESTLGIKIAVSVGVVQRFLVGDPNIQLLEALAGHEVDQVVSIHDVLERGDVAIRADLLSKLEDKLLVSAWRQTAEGAQFGIVKAQGSLPDPQPWPPIPALADEVARRWVYRSVYGRIEAEELEYLTELRQAVPIFVKFAGIDYDQDVRAGEKLDQFVRCVQGVIEQYEGYLCQLTIGGRGTNAFIAFGAPIAHEDNVDRALAAALKLQEETAKLGFIQPVQIGLTQGQLWAGAHGGGAARTYSIIGSEVNLAHRLMSQTTEPGQIVVSPHVAENAPGYAFEQLAPIELKGIEKPMAPYLLLGKVKGQPGFSGENLMLGRAIERGILTLKLSELVSGTPSASEGVFIIEGEAGIGKSRLLSDFMEQAAEMGITVLYGEGDPVERGTQYYAFRPVLESVFNLPEQADPQLWRAAILEILKEDSFLLERAPLLSEILPLQWQDNELTSQMFGEARAESIREVVLGVLKITQAVHRSAPTVLILDDAHWLDYASWNLLGYLVRELPAILFIVSMRPFPEDESGSQTAEAYTRLLSVPSAQRIQLASLTLSDASQLIEQKLGVQALPSFILEFIWARSQGNPFFTEQIAYALRDADIIRIEAGKAVIAVAADELNRIDFPATIQGIITSRIDRLSPSQQLTLKVASVIGRVFLLKMLENVHPSKIGMETLIGQLFALTRLGITDPDASSPEQSYLFRHIITQEVIYGLLTFAQRKQLHCEIAGWYEKNHAEDQSAYYSRLAHHWLNGEVVDKAIEFLDKAGEQALELYANEDVLRFISNAVELDERTYGKDFDLNRSLPRALRRARWERMLGTANLNLGRLADSLTRYKNALRILGQPIPESNLMIGLSLLKEVVGQAMYRIRKGAHQVPIAAGDRWQVDQELAKIGVAGVLYYSQNSALLAHAILFRLNVAERIGSLPDRAFGLIGLSFVAALSQNQRLIDLYRGLAWEAVKQADRTSLHIHIRAIDGLSAVMHCDWGRADEYQISGMQLAEQIGDYREYANLAATRASALGMQGKFEQAFQGWADLYEKMVHKTAVQTLAHSLYGQGSNLLMLGRLDEAIVHLNASLDFLKKSADDKILSSMLYGALSLAALRKGQLDHALEYALAHEQYANPPSAYSLMHFYSGILEAVLGLFDEVLSGTTILTEAQVTQVRRLAERLPKFLKALQKLPVNKAGAFLYMGTYARQIGQKKDAEMDFRKSIEFARRFSQPYELGRACLELGQLPGIPASARREYLAEAVDIFERLRTPHELALVNSALTQLTSASTD